MINLERADPGTFQRRAGTRTRRRRELKFASAFEPWEPANVEIKIVSLSFQFIWDSTEKRWKLFKKLPWDVSRDVTSSQLGGSKKVLRPLESQSSNF